MQGHTTSWRQLDGGPRLGRHHLMTEVGVMLTLLASFAGGRPAAAQDIAGEALSALRADRCDEARALFDGMLERDVDNVDARYGRGLSRLCLGEYDSAAQDLLFAATHWPDRLAVALELGAALTSAGAYQEAEPWLRRAQADPDLEASASLLLGLGHLRLGALDAARDQFIRVAQHSATLAPQAAYYAGVTEFRTGRFSRARAHFERVVQLAPTSGLSREAHTFLNEIDQRRRNKYRLFGGVAFEYDSNVILAPIEPLTRGEQQADGRFVLRAGGAWTPIDDPRVRVDLGYSFFQSLHFELGDFNLQAHEPFVDVATVTPFGRAGLSARFQNYLRSDRLDPFLNQWTLRPSHVAPLGAAGDLELYYRYRGRNFLEAQLDRIALDGTSHATGARHVVPLAARRGSLALGYQFEIDDLGDEDRPTGRVENRFSYDSHSGLAELSWHLPYAVDGSASYNFSARYYSAGSVVDGQRRDDHNHTVSFMLRRDLTSNFELLGGYLAVFNRSNQNLYEYRRHVAIVALSARY